MSKSKYKFCPLEVEFRLDGGRYSSVEIYYGSDWISFTRNALEVTIYYDDYNGFYLHLGEDDLPALTYHRIQDLTIIMSTILGAWAEFGNFLIDESPEVDEAELIDESETEAMKLRWADTEDDDILLPDRAGSHMPEYDSQYYLNAWCNWQSTPTIKSYPMHFDAYCKKMKRFIDG